MRCLAIIVRLLRVALLHLLWRDSQRAEYLADRLAATIGGTTAQIGTLRKLYFADEYQQILTWVLQGAERGGVFAALHRRVAQLPGRELERRHYLARHAQVRLDSTHPPTSYRIAALKTRPCPALATLAAAIDHPGLAEEVAIIEAAFEENLGAVFDRPALWG